MPSPASAVERRYRVEDWPLVRSIRHGEVVTEEDIRFKRGDATYGTLRISSAPVMRNGVVIAGVLCSEDVTEKLKHDEERTNLRAAQQAAIATAALMANVSHELRTPCAGVLVRGGTIQCSVKAHC